MKRLVYLICVIVLGLIVPSCEKESADLSFDIIGKWGMIEGTIGGKEYAPLGPGEYYETIEFKANGTYVEDLYSSDAENKYLRIKDSQYSYYVPTHVTIHSGREITLVMDYGQSGVITKHLVKILK